MGDPGDTRRRGVQVGAARSRSALLLAGPRSLRFGSSSCRWSGVESKIRLDKIVPRVIIEGAPADPRLVAHRLAPGQKRQGVGSDRVPQLPGVAGGYLEDFVRH